MRKNKMMRVASALMVAVLLTTCAISGTFAKYVTTDEFTDQARVAKWGVELQVFGNLFSDTYINTPVKDNANDITVQVIDYASTGTNIVAPGTCNDEGFKISLTGVPEVDGQVSATMTTQSIYIKAGTYGIMTPVSVEITEENYEELYKELFYWDTGASAYVQATGSFDDGRKYFTLENCHGVQEDYYPVVYSLEKGTTPKGAPVEPPATSCSADSLKAIADVIGKKLGLTTSAPDANTGVYTYSGSAVPFNTNEDLAEIYNLDGVTITWAWAIENVDDNDTPDDDTDDISYNGADTILGLLKNIADDSVAVKLNGNNYVAVEEADYCLDTKIEISITVSQVD